MFFGVLKDVVVVLGAEGSGTGLVQKEGCDGGEPPAFLEFGLVGATDVFEASTGLEVGIGRVEGLRVESEFVVVD